MHPILEDMQRIGEVGAANIRKWSGQMNGSGGGQNAAAGPRGFASTIIGATDDGPAAQIHDERNAPADTVRVDVDFEVRCREVYKWAIELKEIGIEWAAWYRQVFGLNGHIRRMFKGTEYPRFMRSQTCADLHKVLDWLRDRDGSRHGVTETTRTITVRMPTSLWENLQYDSGAGRCKYE